MSEPMLDILRSLAQGVGNMTYGDPDNADAVKAADVVRWAADEIDRLREERRRWCTVDGYPGKFEAQPLPPGPEGDG